MLADARKLMADACIKGIKAVASLAGHASYVASVAFSPDGQHIVSGSYDNLVKVWSVSGGKEVASLAGYTDFVMSVAFSPDGQHIVSGSWARCGLCLRGRRLRHWLDTRVMFCQYSVALSPDGQHIVSESRGEGVVVNGTLLSYYIPHYF
jgi:WD40 repeat protein